MLSLTLQFDGDQLAELAELIADGLAAHMGAIGSLAAPGNWLSTRQAAEHVGMSVSELQRAAAAGAVPHAQDGPRCRLYFRADELDAWVRDGRPGRPRRPRLAPKDALGSHAAPA